MPNGKSVVVSSGLGALAGLRTTFGRAMDVGVNRVGAMITVVVVVVLCVLLMIWEDTWILFYSFEEKIWFASMTSTS